MKRWKRAQVALLSFGAVVCLGRNLIAQDAPAATQPAAPEMVVRTAPPLFSEDFESGTLNKDVWDLRVGAAAAGATPATVTVQQDVAAHGKSALLVHYPAGVRTYAFIVAGHLPDSIKEHVFGRAYVQFPKAPPNAHDVFITGGSAGFPISNFLELGLRRNAAQFSYQQNGANIPRGETMIPGPAYPVGKWFCLEWEFNDNPDSMTVWIDGQKVKDTKVGFKGTGEHLIKGFTEFGFGFRSWGNVPNGFDVYYDDIAIDTARIGPVSK